MAVRLSASCNGRALLPRNIVFSASGTDFCLRLRIPQEELAKLKKFNYLIGSGTCDSPACSIVPQPNYATVKGSLFHLMFSSCKLLCTALLLIIEH
jgi:hypothetical protein